MTAQQIEDQADAVIARLNHERRGSIRAGAGHEADDGGTGWFGRREGSLFSS